MTIRVSGPTTAWSVKRMTASPHRGSHEIGQSNRIVFGQRLNKSRLLPSVAVSTVLAGLAGTPSLPAPAYGNQPALITTPNTQQPVDSIFQKRLKNGINLVLLRLPNTEYFCIRLLTPTYSGLQTDLDTIVENAQNKSPTINNVSVQVSGQGKYRFIQIAGHQQYFPETFEAVLQLLTLQPEALTSEAIAIAKAELQRSLQEGLTDLGSDTELPNFRDEVSATLFQLLYPNRPTSLQQDYQQRLANLTAVDEETVRQFAASKYAPRNFTLGIVGNVDLMELVRTLGSRFSPELNIETASIQATEAYIPLTEDQNTVLIAPMEKPKTYISRGWKVPPLTEREKMSLLVVQNLLDGTPAARLLKAYRGIIDIHNHPDDIGTNFELHSAWPTVQVNLAVSPQQEAKAIATLNQVFQNLSQVSWSDVLSAKMQVLQTETSAYHLALLPEPILRQLDEALYIGTAYDEDLLPTHKKQDLIIDIGLADIQAVIKKVFGPPSATVVLRPEGTGPNRYNPL